MDWLLAHWEYLGVPGLIGGVLALLRKLGPGLWGLLVNAGSAPYYKGTTEVAERLLEIKTRGEARALAALEEAMKELEERSNDFEKSLVIIKDLKRNIAELQDSLASLQESSPSTLPPSSSDPPSSKRSGRRTPTSS